MQNLALKTLKEKLIYYPDLGIFIWKVSSRRTKAGSRAGNATKQGYRQIMINNKNYLEHRLAWFYINESFPNGDIDHRNLNKADNRIENLRVVNDSLNKQNTPKYKNNLSGYKGVVASGKKWISQITVDYKHHYLGTFETKELAYEAYCNKAKEIHKINLVNQNSVI